jgi:succinate dehydrogenase hydrophobic anchor subunit
MQNETMRKVIIWVIVLAMVLSLALGLVALVFSP